MESPGKPEFDHEHEQAQALASLHTLASRLKFRQLRVLIAIENMGSAHRAAKWLHMTQPGLSKALRDIETALGVALFVRSPQGLLPTPQGQCAIRHARLMFASLQQMHTELEMTARGSGRRIAVGAIGGALTAVLADALVLLQRRHPDVAVVLYEDTSANLLEKLQSGTIDLALCRTSVAVAPAQFNFDWLCHESVGVGVSPEHPLAKRELVTLAEAAEYPWILFPGHMPLRTLLEREAASQNVVFEVSPIETSSTFATALLLSKSRDWVALFSSETIDFFEQRHALTRLSLRIESTAEPYGIVTRAGLEPNASVQALQACLRECAPKR